MLAGCTSLGSGSDNDAGPSDAGGDGGSGGDAGAGGAGGAGGDAGTAGSGGSAGEGGSSGNGGMGGERDLDGGIDAGPDAEVDTRCDLLDCGAYGTCEIAQDAPRCACHSGHDGDLCDACEEGLQLQGTECVVVPCDAADAPSCGEHGECSAATGTTVDELGRRSSRVLADA